MSVIKKLEGVPVFFPLEKFYSRFNLTTQAKPFHHFVITLYVRALQVIKQTSALRDHLEQPAPRVIVFLVCFEMFREMVDALA